MEVDPALTERIRNTQEEQDAAWIYGPPTTSGTVNVVEYDPTWPQLFSREQQRIQQILGDTALSVDHVGSTSVPGLAAKPIIDIDLVVPNSADESTSTCTSFRLAARKPIGTRCFATGCGRTKTIATSMPAPNSTSPARTGRTRAATHRRRTT